MLRSLREEYTSPSVDRRKSALNTPLRVECVVRRTIPGHGIGVTITLLSKEARTRYEVLLLALSLGPEISPGSEELASLQSPMLSSRASGPAGES